MWNVLSLPISLLILQNHGNEVVFELYNVCIYIMFQNRIESAEWLNLEENPTTKS